jgi:hypothetical protein
MRNIIIPDILKISAVFFALQMLILSAAELQIRQDEACAEPETCNPRSAQAPACAATPRPRPAQAVFCVACIRKSSCFARSVTPSEKSRPVKIKTVT